jgi:D-beta-D-heptose 7-phosphate kinase/D-beta-D-heptose 1-phosphate adenosyltransferase
MPASAPPASPDLAADDWPLTTGDWSAAGILARFSGCTVLVLGDVMLDRYVEGEVRRISPEAPIPVLRARQRRAVLGGAANVARNVAALGARAILIGVVGADAAAADLAALLDRDAQVAPHLIADPSRPTTVKTRFMAGAHQMLRLDEEAADPVGDEVADALLAAFRATLAGADVVVLSDYAKGVLSDRVLAEAIAQARAAGCPVIADPKRAGFAAYRGVSVLTPNEAEVTRATGIETHDDRAVDEAGRRAMAQAGAAAVLVTRSEKGMTLLSEGAPPLHLPTRAQSVADVSGAGDTVVATLAIMLACEAGLAEAAAMANLAAGLSVGKAGTATVGHGELAAALHRRDLLAVDHKVATLAAALERIAAWRAAGLRIGFTNGCFDLIHPGHVHLLHRARAACDRLVVGLNSDASVRRLKGPARPVQTETARATVMASMAAADLVVLFEEDTPMTLIEAIVPDLLFKGADYTEEQVVGAAFVRRHGGRVALIDLQAGHSTTGTIGRIAAATAG